MAGIGEATAILAVAQLGISLSNTLIAYVGEVQDAPFRIQRIGNEVLTTSERLKDIGELVDKNDQTRIFSDEGVHSAVRCSEECRKILSELKSILSKGGWHQWSKGQDKDEIDTSLFSTLWWPFLKTKLEVPRAELERIKIDLMLLFSSAMALGASTTVDKAKFRQDIPGLNRTRDWAARMAEQARKRALVRERGSRPRTMGQDQDWIEGEPAILQEFVDFQERRMQEEEDKRLAERAALLLAEKEEQRKKAEEERRELEKQILEKHKQEQDEIQARTARKKEGFRNELERAGLGPDQIETILESSNLSYSEANNHFSVPDVRPAAASREVSSESASVRTWVVERRRGTPPTTSKANNKWRLRLPWRHPRKPRSDTSSVSSGYHSISERGNSGPANKTLRDRAFEIEAWLIDVFSHERVMLWPSSEWFDAKWDKVLNTGDVWHEFARLKPLWRTAILQFMKFKNQDEENNWNLLLIEIPQRSSRMRLIGHKSDDQLIQLILFSRRDTISDGNDSKDPSKPATIDNLPNLPVQQSDASAIRVQAGDPPHNIRNSDDEREEIRRLEAEKDALRLERGLADKQKETINGKADGNTSHVRYVRRVDSNGIHPTTIRRTEEIITPRDNMDGPIEVVKPYEEEAITRQGQKTSTRARDPFYTGDNTLHGRQGALVKFDHDRYERERPMPRNRRFEEEGDEIIIRERPRSWERHREEEDIVIRSRSKSRERRYEEDEIVLQRRDTDRSRDTDGGEFPDFLREDYGHTTGRGGVIIDDAQEERHKYSSPQQQQLIIRRPEREYPRERSWERRRPPEREEIIIRRNERSPSTESRRGRVRPPKHERIVIRALERGQPGRSYTNDTVRDTTLSRRPTLGSPDPRSPNQDFALVRRTGGSRRVNDYMQDRVLDKSIRIRGEDHSRSPAGRYSNIRRFSAPFKTRQHSSHERGRAPIPRRLGFTMHGDSEDDDDVRMDYAEKKSSSETELTDEELIARTLKRFTTFQPDEALMNSVTIPNGLVSTALPSVHTETDRKAAGTSEDAGQSAFRAAQEQSGHASHGTSAATSASKLRERQTHDQGAMSGDSQRPMVDQVTTDEVSIAHGFDTGVILEEPAVMTDEDGPTKPVRSNTSKRQARFADGSEFAKSVAARFEDAGYDLSSVKDNSIFQKRHSRPRSREATTDDGRFSGSEEDGATYSRREQANDRTSEARKKRLEAETLLREADELSRIGQPEEGRASRTKSMPKKTTNSRSSTVEDFKPQTRE